MVTLPHRINSAIIQRTKTYYGATKASIKTITLMMPTKVVFIIKMPSVKMEIA